MSLPEQPTTNPFLEMLEYDGAEIQGHIRDMCADQDYAEHAQLQVLWVEFFLPFFGHAQTLRTDAGKTSPIAVTIYDIEIAIHSIYCALSAFIMLTEPRPPNCSGSPFKYALWILVLLGKWSLRINENPCRPSPDTYSIVIADPEQPRNPGFAKVSLFVCGTTKSRERGGPGVSWTEGRQRVLQNATGMHPQAKLAQINNQWPNDKFYWFRAPLLRDITWIKNQISQVFSQDPALVRTLNSMLDLFREIPGLSDENAPRHTFGSCAETWGIQILATSLASGAIGTSFSMSAAQLESMETALQTEDWRYGLGLKPACSNCLYLYGVVRLNHGVTIRDYTRL
ncbi:hypothetical protein Q9L58_001473 [Maublancomyces gigas]|uniref:Uncharacterized protein n=1 Tax=Discina gigas TaxID=1032678 RepID=A0ABR3GUH7_9PEZI